MEIMRYPTIVRSYIPVGARESILPVLPAADRGGIAGAAAEALVGTSPGWKAQA